MDRDNEYLSYGAPRTSVAPELRLKKLRDRLNEPVFAYRPTARPRRVISYVRTRAGEDPTRLFEQLDREAARRGWHVGHRLHDDNGAAAPQQSPDWLRARRLMHEGFADGVLAPDRDHISRDDDQYQAELAFVADSQCFTALVVPEAAP
ncbi:hypothetical protein RM550_26180 [Streptomyces sp. DSM 41527]|uniref:Resolvase/invertase-type recombinase catalytic domain-containing protein n=1 Tax=Streptomyces mooreae TaxID=3075523 RepID=A0ABU2TDZ3_9ACTN|nr:hypothetical protein [Streptomyces sp. DSM 41527]MDT0459163.1 hypothetical protein [Streptomyces sp. DSM 41527]